MGAEAAAAAATTTTTTSVAPGFRFHPTDEELAWYYLKRKVCGKSFRLNAISELDIYKSEPWDLPGQSMLESKDLEWYFFSPVDKKYANGSRFNRSTGKGYWKATGNDRTIRHGSRTVGFKKTLVFHSGRAPYGKRTNWVMHEYRLVDEELRKSGVAQDAFVLCKILQKGGLGPPNGERYAPFVEEEWDDDGSVLVPGEDVGDDAVARDDGHVEGKDPEQDPQSINEAPLRQSELQRDAANVSPVCKSERLDDCSLPCIPDPGPTSLIGNKRSRHDEPDPSHSNASETSTTTTQEPCPYTTTMNFSSARLEFPLMESIEPKEHRPVSPSTFDAANLDKFVPPGYLKLINNLQNEIHRLSSERETLKIDLMSAQAEINILQSQIDFLKRENEDLKRIV